MRSLVHGFAVVLLAGLVATPLAAQDKRLRIAVPDHLIETGFLKHVFPRFSLKNGIPIRLVAPGADAMASLSADPTMGRPVFSGGDTVWHLAATPGAEDNPLLDTLFAWLASDAGQRAIESFAGSPAFRVERAKAREVVQDALPGNVQRGANLSLRLCGRCHVIGPQNRMEGVGSTPSFAVLRTLTDWQERFEAFYSLNPHPSFTQVEAVTPPFPDEAPPATAPLSMNLQDLDDITAYAASVVPADLGAPIAHQ